MGKKNRSNNLGRSLIKDRFSNNHGRKMVDNSMFHTTETEDGYNWGRLNLQSVTEESSFQEFLSTAELAGTEFHGEKLNVKFVNWKTSVDVLTKEEIQELDSKFQENKDVLKIPRRPPWDVDITADELHQREYDSFLEWRRSLATLQDEKGLLLTPYEKNIEFWRQLWRVIERSDIVIQIVDARNPLLFWCEDLSRYVNEISENKLNLVLLNKADYLTDTQRQYWSQYFTRLSIPFAFFSAVLTDDKTDLYDIKEEVEKLDAAVENVAHSLSTIIISADELINTKSARECQPSTHAYRNASDDADVINFHNNDKILTKEELIEYLKTIHVKPKLTEGITTVGLVGYPNVGKSSTINLIMDTKKVSVSATPGKTKHFQTLYVDKELVLCDCPGLVMPSFMYTKAEMIINGILPVDQVRDHVPAINLISSLIPRHVIEEKYGIMLPKPLEGEDEDRCPTAEEILDTYAYNRGFMTANGQPDNARAARYVIKDFINGKLLYAHPPPSYTGDYHKWPPKKNSRTASANIKATLIHRPTTEELDKVFFTSTKQGVHIKGGINTMKNTPHQQLAGSKPWKQLNKHANKKKKEKLRRVYAHLDQH